MSALLMNSLKDCIKDGFLTPDLGGHYNTNQVTKELCLRLKKQQ